MSVLSWGDILPNKAVNVLKVVIAVAILVLLVVFYKDLVNFDIKNILSNSDDILKAIAVVLIVFFIKSIVFVVPVSIVYVGVGVFFSPLLGILVNSLGTFLELTTTYFLGRFWGGDKVEKRLAKNPIFSKIIQADEKHTFFGLVLMRFMPLPLDFGSLFLGTVVKNYPLYLLTSFIGLFPRIIICSALGKSIFDATSPQFRLAVSAYVIIVASSLYFYYRYFRRIAKQIEEKNDQTSSNPALSKNILPVKPPDPVKKA